MDTYQSLKRIRNNYKMILAIFVTLCIILSIAVCYQLVFEHTGQLKMYELSFGLGENCTEEQAEEYRDIIGQTLGEELEMGFSTYLITGGSWDGEKIVYDGLTARFLMIDTDNKLTDQMVKDAVRVAQSRTNNGFVMMEQYWIDANLIFPIDYGKEQAETA